MARDLSSWMVAFLFPIAWGALGAAAHGGDAPCQYQQLTSTTGGYIQELAASADGRWVAFQSSHDLTGQNVDGSGELFRLDTTTGTFQQITSTPVNSFPRSPGLDADGRHLVFQWRGNPLGTNPDGNEELFLHDAQTGALTQLTVTSGGPVGWNQLPTISADGSTVAFYSNLDHTGQNPDGNPEVFLLDTGSLAVTQITITTGASSERPAIDGSGTIVAFSSTADLTGQNPDGNYEIFVHDVSTGTFQQLTFSTGGQNSDTRISSDGTVVAFSSNTQPAGGHNPDGNGEAFAVEVASGILHQVTDTNQPAVNGAPSSVSADGAWVSVHSRANLGGHNPDGGNEAYAFHVPTGTLLQLTSEAAGVDSFQSVLVGGPDDVLLVSESDATGGNPDGNTELQRATACLDQDCDGNGTQDLQDLVAGTHSDVDHDGIPDICQALFVDASALPGGDGLSWSTAFSDLQDALALAGGGKNQVWVAAGVYNAGVPGDADATFSMRSGVALYGGFSGGESRVDTRNPIDNVTSLRGHFGGPTNYHVVSAIGVDHTAILDGFLVSVGRAVGATEETSRGGGIYILGGAPTIRSCRIELCQAAVGAGMYVQGSAPTVSDTTFYRNGFPAETGGAVHIVGSAGTFQRCLFRANEARSGGGMYLHSSSTEVLDSQFLTNGLIQGGGGVCIDAGSTPVFRNVTFWVNSAFGRGGAARIEASSPSFWNCRFTGNQLTRANPGGGGAIWHGSGSAATIVNALFSFNRTCFYDSQAGGAVFHEGGDGLRLVNSVFYANRATTSNGSTANALGAGLYCAAGSPLVEGCVFWGNHASGNLMTRDIHVASGAPLVWQTCIETGWSGAGGDNYSSNPLFRDPPGADGRLGTPDDNLRLELDSPCIDRVPLASLPADSLDLDNDGDTLEPLPLDLDRNPRARDGDGSLTVEADSGAFEFPTVRADLDLDDGQTLVLGAASPGADPLLEPVVEITNTSGTDDATVRAADLHEDPYPGTSGFQVLGRSAFVGTSLPDGAYWMRVSVPFALEDLDGADPLGVDLATYDRATRTWVPAAALDTQPSPGHAGPLGDRFPDTGTSSLPLSTDLGDYGVFWNPIEQRGFAWANVDHTTAFAAGLPADCTGNGIPDYQDILAGASDCSGNWIPDSCEPDCNANGVPDPCDLQAGTSMDENENGVPDECDPDPKPALAERPIQPRIR